jgi:3-deoxy-manno-octulosonate cytidylyltransferase (CMP-KDO synthetase)
MVKDDVPSGSERINLAYQRYFADGGYDLIINVQGDEPLLPGTEISRLASFHLNKGFNIATVVREKRDLTSDSFNDPNHVKVIYSKESSKCHYFSRAPIPFKRKRDQNDKDEKWFLHIGIYSYRPKALSSFCSSKRSRYESLEELEQLRALELGMSIGAIESDCNLMGVDLPEDIKKIEGVLSGEDN